VSKAYPSAEYLVGLALKAGRIIKKHFGLGMPSEIKTDGSPVTEADTAINRFVIKAIRHDFPHVRVIGEEASRDVDGAEYTLYCDPVDGTIPYSLGIPASTFVVSVTRKHEPLTAVIYDPFLGRMWVATKGVGAHLIVGSNKYPAKVSSHANLKCAHVGYSWRKDSPYHMHQVVPKLVEAEVVCSSLRSIAYYGGLIASGMVEAHIFPGRSMLETAAMQLIVSEAGGRVTNILGHPMRYEACGEAGVIKGHVVSNGLIHDELVSLILSCQPADR
jgi:myo-inositol-1(or 4)-monophosphatase